jgi:hypothetical protein
VRQKDVFSRQFCYVLQKELRKDLIICLACKLHTWDGTYNLLSLKTLIVSVAKCSSPTDCIAHFDAYLAIYLDFAIYLHHGAPGRRKDKSFQVLQLLGVSVQGGAHSGNYKAFHVARGGKPPNTLVHGAATLAV